jgi:transposase
MYFQVQDLKNKGLSERAISRELKISRATVKKHARMNLPLANAYFQAGVRKASEFDQYKDFISEKYQKHPHIRMSNLYHQLKEHYPDVHGGERAFRVHVQKHRSEYSAHEVKVRHFEPVTDYEPGKQIQVDAGEEIICTTDSDCYKVYFVSFIMSWSRQMYVSYASRPYNTEMFIKAHLEAFQFFGGITRECLYDQTKLVVIKEQYRELILNDRFGKFALETGFHVTACEGYDPQSKGMVEKSVAYIKGSFLQGREFSGIDDVRRRSQQWLSDVANVRIHTTTKRRPQDMFFEEQSYLQRLNSSSMITDYREADKTGLINYKGLKYSVPSRHQNKRVGIRVLEEILYVYNLDLTECIAEWDLGKHRENINKNRNHYRDYRKTVLEVREEVLAILQENCIPDAEALLTSVTVAVPHNPRDQYRGLRSLLFKYGREVWLENTASIMSLPIISCMRIENILKAAALTADKARIKQCLTVEPQEVERSDFRSLSYYDRIGQGV